MAAGRWQATYSECHLGGKSITTNEKGMHTGRLQANSVTWELMCNEREVATTLSDSLSLFFFSCHYDLAVRSPCQFMPEDVFHDARVSVLCHFCIGGTSLIRILTFNNLIKDLWQAVTTLISAIYIRWFCLCESIHIHATGWEGVM